jgi:hypothetical protein
MKVTTDFREFEKKLNNIVNYSVGFLDGAQKGKTVFLNNLGKNVITVLKQYVDSEARSNPMALHHIYEWYKTGSPSARLYDFDYTVSNLGLSLKSNFKQSTSIANGSSTPFYNKAKIMEEGVPITISPKKSNVLVFEADGETVFTTTDVTIENPGGQNVAGSFEKIIDEFFNVYFKQSFLMSSGLNSYIKNPIIYKRNFVSGSLGGKSVGVTTGFKWITNMKIGVE